jgi:hypothetical protein
MRYAAPGRSPAVETSRKGSVSLRPGRAGSEQPLRLADDSSFDRCDVRSQISDHNPFCIRSSLQTRSWKDPNRKTPTGRD